MPNHWEILASGRVIVSNTPEELWANAVEYFKWCDNNPLEINEVVKVGKEAGTTIANKKTRPYTVKGLCIHCGITEQYLNDLSRMKDDASDYYFVVSRIGYVIHTQNLEYAMINEFNPVLTGRVLNIDAGDELPSNIKVIVDRNTPPLAKSENEILENLDLEFDKLKEAKENFLKEKTEDNGTTQ